MTTSRAALLGASTLLALACGTSTTPSGGGPAPGTNSADAAAPEVDGGGSPTDAGPQATPDANPVGRDVTAQAASFTSGLATAICARLDACCADEARELFFSRFRAANGSPFTLSATPGRGAECTAALNAQLGIVHGIWAASVGRGMMTFDEGKAAACIDTMSAAGCGLPLAAALAADAPCFDSRGDGVWKRVGPVGATCRPLGDGVGFYTECAQNQGFCSEREENGTPRPKNQGVCKAWSKDGEDCKIPTSKNAASYCAPGLACPNPLGSKCSPNSPELPPATSVGDVCYYPDNSYRECPAGAYCDSRTRTCLTQKADGEECVFGSDCRDSHWASCVRRAAADGGAGADGGAVPPGRCASRSFCAAP